MMKVQEAQKAIKTMGVEEIQRSLRLSREIAGLNQLDLAKLSGVPQSNIHRIEEGKQGVTPRMLTRLMNAIEKGSQKRIRELEKENSILLGVQSAAAHAALCRTLPWMKSQLPAAEARLAEKKAEAAKLSDRDSLDNPIVRGVLDSLYREIKVLENASGALARVYEQIAGDACLHFADAVLNRESLAVEAYEKWKATGETDYRVVIDKIDLVESDE